jgi:hypothetical protein
MKAVHNFLRLTSAITCVFGLVLLLIPDFVESVFLIGDLIDSSLTRFLGASLLGHSYADFKALRIILTTNIISLVIAVIISVVSVAMGSVHNRILFFLAVHGFFLVGFWSSLRKLDKNGKL